ncbi:MAG TPA: spore coat protein CotJB [Firmicutes bacterium]|nr:spore coat protein CotJB [Bacillota bacterium]
MNSNMNGMNTMNEKSRMLRRIDGVDFAIDEMTLYLDTHPTDGRALKTLEQYRKRRAELIGEYESRFGPYVLTSNDASGSRWNWIDNPWPWDIQAN